MEAPPLLLNVLAEFSKSQGNKPLFTWLGDRGQEERSLTYEEFDAVTTALALTLVQKWKLVPGEPVMLVYPPGLDFIITFFACLKAAVVAVPVYPPRPGMSKDINMFIAVQGSCNAKTALTCASYDFAKRVTAIKQFVSKGKAKWPELTWHVTDTKLPKLGSQRTQVPELTSPTRDSIAFLQYTSGSTALPKGVIISHGNLAHNLKCIITALKASESTRVVSWLPQYHDMGLIGSHMGSIYCGGSAWFLSPISFIKSPPLWIEMISKYQATHIQAPNFAYKLVVRKWKVYKTAEALNLSSVCHIFNAAEPIEAQVIDHFCQMFEKYGLNASAMSTGYGLAEHTVYVCDGGSQRLWIDKNALEKENKVVMSESANDPGNRCIVGCGYPHREGNKWSGVRVQIVNPDSCEALGDNMVGEIWVDSKSKAQGYFNLPDKTASDFHAKITSGSDNEAREREWLRTGDLGFFHNEELFVCGRIKDLIIIRGRNHYPQDLELTVENCSTIIRPGCVAAFTSTPSAGSEEDRLVIVAEIRDNETYDDVAESIRNQIVQDHGVRPAVIVLIRERTIPKTTSGKISRFRVREAFESDSLQKVHTLAAQVDDDDMVVEETDLADEADQTATTPAKAPVPIGANTHDARQLQGVSLIDALKDEVARLLEGEATNISTTVPLIQLGLDSMALIQFKGILQNSYNTEIEEVELFDEETTLETIRRRVEGEPPNPKFFENGHAAPKDAAKTTANNGSNKQAPKAKQRKQQTFGCFAICGC